jgi:hypothetical protein
VSGLGRRAGSKLRLARAWVRSALAAPRHARAFADVELFCLFVGYSRSGHSLVGSLIDAHPDAIIAHEANALRYIKYGFRRGQIFSELLRNSLAYAEAGRSATGYSYVVPGQWQGRYRRLRVIGDKRGGGSVRRLIANPALRGRLERLVRVPVRYVHVVRNPFDNISTIYLKSRQRDVLEASEFYFHHVEGVAALKQEAGERVYDLHHEDLIRDPRGELAALCRVLGLDPDPEYLEACASIVFAKPRRTRDEVVWHPSYVDLVARRAHSYPFLARYRFEG